MPRFRKGAATSPLLPAHGASSLGLSKKKSSSSGWASVGEAGLAFVIAGGLFAAIIYCLVVRILATKGSRMNETAYKQQKIGLIHNFYIFILNNLLGVGGLLAVFGGSSIGCT
jgi:hypothetical protein